MKYLLHMEIQAVINVKVYTSLKLTFKFIDCAREANLAISDILRFFFFFTLDKIYQFFLLVELLL